MKLDDVMTTQEAGERWNVPADSIKQCCLKRYANKQFTDDEARKSGKMWLVTRKEWCVYMVKKWIVLYNEYIIYDIILTSFLLKKYVEI